MRSPISELIVGILGGILFGCWSFWLFFVGEQPYNSSQIELIHGQITHWRVIHRHRGYDTLELWLDDNPVPYRSQIGAPRYRQKVDALLSQGAEVDIGILAADRVKPRKDYLRGQRFVPIYSLTVNSAVVFSLDDYNRWSAENQKGGKIVAPIMLAVGISLIIHGIHGIRARSRIT